MPPKSIDDVTPLVREAAVVDSIPAKKNADPTISSTSSSALKTATAAEASMAARYTCASGMVAIFAVWGKFTFVTDGVPGGTIPLHSWKVPVAMNVFYLVSLPLLRLFTERVLAKAVDVKTLLKESMLVYNIGQVILNGWMVYAFIDAVMFRGHPFIGGAKDMVETGVTYAVWVHYCDKYLEYLDTYFMVLRGRMDQVSFLHVYHHTSISIAWWIGLKVYPGGDSYFGALFNSFIHVLMYSYYAMALLKISCPWKKYLTQAQLLQFTSVVLFSVCGIALPSVPKSWEAYLAHFVQDFEMISLFVLFMAFYRKAYSSKKKTVPLSKPIVESPPRKEDVSIAESVSSDESSAEGQEGPKSKKQ